MHTTDSHIDVTVILTTYNEEHLLRMGKHEQVRRALEASPWSWEILFIDDASRDGSAAVLEQFVAGDPRLCLLRNEKNLGRGGTVARALREARGRVAGFLDLDCSIRPDVLPDFVDPILRGDIDAATACRHYRIGKSRDAAHIAKRWVFTMGYRAVSSMLLPLPAVDTPSGCKFFNREKILPILDSVKNQRWFWQTELLLRAARAGLRVREIHVPYYRDSATGTTVTPLRDIMEYIDSIARVRRELRREKQRFSN